MRALGLYATPSSSFCQASHPELNAVERTSWIDSKAPDIPSVKAIIQTRELKLWRSGDEPCDRPFGKQKSVSI